MKDTFDDEIKASMNAGNGSKSKAKGKFPPKKGKKPFPKSNFEDENFVPKKGSNNLPPQFRKGA